MIIALIVGIAIGMFLDRRIYGEHIPNEPAVNSSIIPGPPNSFQSLLSLTHSHQIYIQQQEEADFQQKFSNYMEPNIRSGSREDDRLINQLLKHFSDSDFFQLETHTFKTFVHVPDYERPNSVIVKDKNGNVVIEDYVGCKDTQSVNGTTFYKKGQSAYMVHSKAGKIEGEIVYLNYGRQVDIFAAKNRSIILAGRIALIRNGEDLLEKIDALVGLNMTGCLVFETGSRKEDCTGETPTINLENEYTDLSPPINVPMLPIQSISCHLAQSLLMRMEGRSAPTSWNAGLNVSTFIGRKSDRSPEWTVAIETLNTIREVSITTIVATIRGEQYPDQYIAVGSSRFTSSMASSTSSLDSLSGLPLYLLYSDRPPKRTLKLLSFGGAEWGDMGRNQYFESHRAMFHNKLVAYINLDDPVLVDDGLTVTSDPALVDLVTLTSDDQAAALGDSTDVDLQEDLLTSVVHSQYIVQDEYNKRLPKPSPLDITYDVQACTVASSSVMVSLLDAQILPLNISRMTSHVMPEIDEWRLGNQEYMKQDDYDSIIEWQNKVMSSAEDLHSYQSSLLGGATEQEQDRCNRQVLAVRSATIQIQVYLKHHWSGNGTELLKLLKQLYYITSE